MQLLLRGATIIDANTVMLPDGSKVIAVRAWQGGKVELVVVKIVELMGLHST